MGFLRSFLVHNSACVLVHGTWEIHRLERYFFLFSLSAK